MPRKAYCLQNQHAVAVAIKTIPLQHGFSIGAQDQPPAGERRHQHQERGAGEMEIGEQPVHRPELEPGTDKKVGRTRPGEEAALLPGAFQGPDDCRPDGEDRPGVFLARTDRPGRFWTNSVPLREHPVVIEAVDFDGLKGCLPDFEVDGTQRGALFFDAPQDPRCEVKPGRGRGDRPIVAGKNRLVSLPVELPQPRLLPSALDIGRKRCVPDFFQSPQDVTGGEA
jgi:hypothetical protein